MKEVSYEVFTVDENIQDTVEYIRQIKTISNKN